jgi:hypothetical protein
MTSDFSEDSPLSTQAGGAVRMRRMTFHSGSTELAGRGATEVAAAGTFAEVSDIIAAQFLAPCQTSALTRDTNQNCVLHCRCPKNSGKEHALRIHRDPLRLLVVGFQVQSELFIDAIRNIYPAMNLHFPNVMDKSNPS